MNNCSVKSSRIEVNPQLYAGMESYKAVEETISDSCKEKGGIKNDAEKHS